MQRVLIRETESNLGKEITLYGRIINLRKMGGLTFVVLQDYTGQIQVVFEKEIEAKFGEAVSITGKPRKDERATGGVEVQGKELSVISKNIEDLPLDLSKTKFDLQLSTLLDLRTISLRHPKIQAIFKIYDLLLEAYEKVR